MKEDRRKKIGEGNRRKGEEYGGGEIEEKMEKGIEREEELEEGEGKEG